MTPNDEGISGRVQALTYTVIAAAFALVLVLFSVECPHSRTESRSDYARRTLGPEPAPVLRPSPPLSDEVFPCVECHNAAEPVDTTRRVLKDDHETLTLAHGDLWCLSCHSPAHRDQLQLADGTLVEMTESWKLCTQCHGKKLADWRAGVHGKRTGFWWGPKEYRACVECHNPHAPPFKPLKPLPPPMRPGRIGAPMSAQASTTSGTLEGAESE
jgi:hypothetical protein